MVILFMPINGYFIGAYSWLYYSYLLMVILLVPIHGYIIHAY
jgi:hypothetical protein